MSPTIERPHQLLLPLFLLVACARDGDFTQQAQSLRTRTTPIVAAAGRCADDLRALVDGDPEAVSRALDRETAMGHLSALHPPPATVGLRSRQEIDRREGEVRAALAVITSALEVGPAALDRMLTAATQSRDVTSRLCEARDTASTDRRHDARTVVAA